MAKLTLTVEVLDDPANTVTLTVLGREAWALKELIAAGDGGCTPINVPGPRWSDYVFKLRRHGVNVETVHEPHGGQFAGTHARYKLRSLLRVLSIEGERSAA